MRGGHTQVECKDPDCGGMCNACCLAMCAVCRGVEGSLPTECPGREMTEQEQTQVYEGALDYSGGRWHQDGAL